MLGRMNAPAPDSLRDHAVAWQGLVTAVLSHGASVPQRLAALGAEAPDSPAFLATKGLLFLLLGRRELKDEAAGLHAAALRARGAGGAQDRVIVDALGLWLGGRPSHSAALFDEHLRTVPTDAFAVKMAQAIRFLYGDVMGMRASADAAVGGFTDDHPHAGYVHGCYAFACEETGDLQLAERAGVKALELAPDDAWALHAVAHVHEMRGHPERGRDWLLERRDAFAGCSTFRHHVWWHYALFELELGAVDSVLDLYDTEVRREPTDDYRDIANAVSLLARLEAEGVDVGDRWEELAAIAERRVDDACVVFADLHYLMALLATGKDEAADRMIARLGAAGDGSEFGAISVAAGAPAGGGLAAMARGNHDEALQALLTARRTLQAIGGSHAQRDVFERLTVDAAIRAGRTDEARRLVTERAQHRGAYDRWSQSRLVRCGPAAVHEPLSTAAAF